MIGYGKIRQSGSVFALMFCVAEGWGGPVKKRCPRHRNAIIRHDEYRHELVKGGQEGCGRDADYTKEVN
jgi:hypothetical protein